MLTDEQHQYLDALQGTLPAELRTGLEQLNVQQRWLTDIILRFALGGVCPAAGSDTLRREWAERQPAATQALQQLRTQTNGKRAREEEQDEDEEQHEAKRVRASSGEDQGQEGEDRPLYTLHALSVTAPARKKLDIRIHERSLRLLNPSTQAVEHSIPLHALRRAFLLPTRGKTRAHWTVLLMSADASAPVAKGAAKEKEKDKPEKDVQIVFGVDAAPGAYSTTDHTAPGAAPAQHARGTPVLPFLRAFLAHVPVPLREPDPAVFRSAIATDAQGTPLAGVQAYRAAKEGTLWFFDDGILWDGRPAEFWSCSDLVGSANAAGEAGTGSDGVRLVSATGRTCSVFVRRRVGGAERKEGEDEEDVECIETDFNMVDGREQDGITTWVKRHKHLFGRPPPEPQADAEGYGIVNGKVDLKGKGKAVAPPAEDSEDEDDSDFVDDDDSDGGSATSESGSEGGGSGNEGAEDEDGEGDEDDGGEDDDDEELDPARHPLLRPGAMPKMSKAAMDAAVGMLMDDFVGGSGKGKGKAQAVESDEEDELED